MEHAIVTSRSGGACAPMLPTVTVRVPYALQFGSRADMLVLERDLRLLLRCQDNATCHFFHSAEFAQLKLDVYHGLRVPLIGRGRAVHIQGSTLVLYLSDDCRHIEIHSRVAALVSAPQQQQQQQQQQHAEPSQRPAKKKKTRASCSYADALFSDHNNNNDNHVNSNKGSNNSGNHSGSSSDNNNNNNNNNNNDHSDSAHNNNSSKNNKQENCNKMHTTQKGMVHSRDLGEHENDDDNDGNEDDYDGGDYDDDDDADDSARGRLPCYPCYKTAADDMIQSERRRRRAQYLHRQATIAAAEDGYGASFSCQPAVPMASFLDQGHEHLVGLRNSFRGPVSVMGRGKKKAAQSRRGRP